MNERKPERRKSISERERPRRSGPRPPRPQTGNAQTRELTREERMRQSREEAEQRRAAALAAAEAERRAAEAPPEVPPAPEVRQAPKKHRVPAQTGAAQRAPVKKKRRRPRLRNTNFHVKFLTMLAVVAVLVLGLMIFFKTRHIEVVGNVYYSAEDVVDACGVQLEDNLLSVSKANVSARIHTVLPYISEVQIKKKLPDTLIITVAEFEVTYAVQDELGGWWLINREGRVLEPADAQSVKGHLQLTGMSIQVPAAGEAIEPAVPEGADAGEIAAKRNAALVLLPLIEKSPFAQSIVTLDVSASYDIVLWYGTQFEIRLGNTENIEYKLQYLQAVLEELGKEKSGVIDLTFSEDKGVHFLPFG